MYIERIKYSTQDSDPVDIGQAQDKSQFYLKALFHSILLEVNALVRIVKHSPSCGDDIWDYIIEHTENVQFHVTL